MEQGTPTKIDSSRLVWLNSNFFVAFKFLSSLLITPHAQRERGKVIDRGVRIYI